MSVGVAWFPDYGHIVAGIFVMLSLDMYLTCIYIINATFLIYIWDIAEKCVFKIFLSNLVSRDG